MRQKLRQPRKANENTAHTLSCMQENLEFAELIESHLQEACSGLSIVKIEETVTQWLSRHGLGRKEIDAKNTLFEAFALAAQLLLFTPSMTGTRQIDRFIRAQSATCSPKALAALQALGQSCFHLLRLKFRSGPMTIEVEDLATAKLLTLINDEIPDEVMGAAIGAYLTPLSNNLFIAIGSITPLDSAAVVEGLSYVREGKGLSNPQRCAAALYRHVIRYGPLWLEGVNIYTQKPVDDPGVDSAPSFDDLDRLALLIKTSLENKTEPCSSDIFEARQLTSEEALNDCLARSILSRQANHQGHAEAYAHLAFIMMETFERRASAGTSYIDNPLDRFSAIIAQELIDFVDVAEVKALFEKLRLKITISKAKSENNKDKETELTRVLMRIQALRSKTIEQGCTEQEALASAKKVAELLDRYGLSLGEVEIREQACEGVGIETGRRRRAPVDDCVPTLGAFCDCKVWSEKVANGAIRYVFFGLPADVKAAHYLYDIITRTFETETLRFRTDSTKYIGSSLRGSINSFQTGLAHGICKKLSSMKKERDDFNRRTSGRDLVPLKSSIVEEELEKLGMNFRSKSIYRKRNVDYDAYEAGHIAGQKFTPHNPAEGV